MFFDFNLQQLADWSSSFDAASFEKELASIAGIATVAAVNSPAVVDAPKGTAPSTEAVQTVVNQVVEAVAPVVAPRVNPTILSKLEKITADEVVANPQVKASDAGVTVSPNVVNNIASSISSTFKTDAQKDLELKQAINTVATTPVTSKPEIVTLPGTTTTTTAKPDSVNLPFDTTKPATSQTMPFDVTKPATTVNLTTTTATATSAANVQTPQNFSGDGTKTRPLLLNGTKFTGERNGIKYENGLPVNATRADILEANRLADEAAEVTKRAATNPLYNPNMRPEGKIDKGYIVYWSWVGGATSGEWRQYRAPITPENMAKYGSRVFSGDTQQSGASAVGSNTLEQQPMPTYDKDGNITGYTLGGKTFTSSGFTGATTTTPSTTTPSTTTPSTTTPSTTTPSTTTPSTTTPSTTTPSTTIPSTTTPSTTAVTTRPTTTATTTTPTTTTLTTTATTTTPVFDINRQSAIKAMQDRFAKYGLSSLANKILELAQDGATEATITLQLQETPEYQMRFRANDERLKKGLTVLTPAEYLNLEDGYRQVLRAYGLRQFDNDAYVQQFISNDVSPAELSNRVVTAVQRVQNADPQIAKTLRDYYGIGQNDLVAYVLDPEQQFQKIERQVAAAEIGTAARLQGIEAGVGTAEALAAQGITQAEARRGYSTIADILPTAEKLSQIYGGAEQAYGLAEAEQEVFNSLAEAQRRRQRLTQREVAAFSGQTGIGRSSLTQQTGGRF